MEVDGKPLVPAQWWTRPGPELFLENARRLLPARGCVLDFGAGRGKYLGAGMMEALVDFRGQGRQVVGFDRDEAVRHNPFLDQAEVDDGSGALPFDDDSFDLIVSLAVFEHIQAPLAVAAELDRVLKPGGWLCALTPHSASYVAIGARLIPVALHVPVLRRLRARRAGNDIFPTHYRMNSLHRLKTLFPRYEDHSYLYSGTPSYTAGIPMLALLAKGWDRGIAARTIHLFKRKPGAPTD